MANIVELREMSDEKLEEMLENAREELFNLRFRKAASQLEDYARLRFIRRQIAQLETVLNNRQQAINAAVEIDAIASALNNKDWQASAHYSYEDSAWQVSFTGENGKELATALIDLNKKRPNKRQAQHGQQKLVKQYEVAG